MNQHFITVKKLNAILIDQCPDNSAWEGKHAEDVRKLEAEQLVLTINAEMMRLGFIMSKVLLTHLAGCSKADLVKLHNELLPVLKKLKGGDVPYKPMYPNFPQQVMEASYLELYLNAIIHYWSLGTWKPQYDEVPRGLEFEATKFVEIGKCSRDDYLGVFTTLLSSNSSLSAEDREIVEYFLTLPDDCRTYPEVIPFKETLCIVIAKSLEQGLPINHLVTNVTDVLRVMTHLSGGDVSLASNTKFKSLPKRIRRQLVAALEDTMGKKERPFEDYARHSNKWVRALHSLHVGDFAKQAPQVAKAAGYVRAKGVKIVTTNSMVEKALLFGDVSEAVQLLKQRPGDFARRLDHIMRRADAAAQAAAIEGWQKVAKNVSTRVLFQLNGHFNARNNGGQRVVFPKGSMTKAVLLKNELPKLETDVVDALRTSVDNTLLDRFSELKPLGKVWIDPDLAYCPIPMQQRSASPGLLNVARGTRLPMTEKDTLRFFIYWVGRDLDLSATLHDEDFRMIERIAYTNLRSKKYKACHSGDITSAPNGAAEFIDITTGSAARHGIRYVVMNVLVYAGPTFAEHKVCYAGWMTRSKPDSNAVFDPKTVEQKIDLRSPAKNAIPVVFDLYERKGIWCDLATGSRVRWGGNNVESNRAAIEDTLRSIVSLDNKPTLHDLFEAHAVARGEIVSDKEEAETIFSLDEGITPFDIDKINADFLA